MRIQSAEVSLYADQILNDMSGASRKCIFYLLTHFYEHTVHGKNVLSSSVYANKNGGPPTSISSKSGVKHSTD